MTLTYPIVNPYAPIHAPTLTPYIHFCLITHIPPLQKTPNPPTVPSDFSSLRLRQVFMFRMLERNLLWISSTPKTGWRRKDILEPKFNEERLGCKGKKGKKDWWCGEDWCFVKVYDGFDSARIQVNPGEHCKQKLFCNQLRFKIMPRQQIDVSFFWKSWKNCKTVLLVWWEVAELLALLMDEWGGEMDYRYGLPWYACFIMCSGRGWNLNYLYIIFGNITDNSLTIAQKCARWFHIQILHP